VLGLEHLALAPVYSMLVKCAHWQCDRLIDKGIERSHSPDT
jgi:hypothetical protein